MALGLPFALLAATIAVCSSTGPPTPFTRGDYYPAVAEPDASGALRDIIRYNSRRYHSTLIVNNSTDIEFAKGTTADVMTPRTRQKLDALSAKVTSRWSNLVLKVLNGWTDKWVASDPKSLHYEGRAADFITSDDDLSKLGELAGLAVEAGFDWVKYPSVGDYIHGSVLSEVCQTAVDLLFILDGSGSVSKSDFEKAKEFVKKVIDFFDVGKNATRIAAIQYSSSVTPQFELDDFYTMSGLKSAVDSIDHKGGSTNSGAALTFARTTIFQEQNGARPSKQGIPRIVVFMTDGRSNRGDLQQPSILLKQTNVNVFSIGIGSNIRVSELEMIASEPPDQHVFLLDSFDDVAGFVDRMSAVSCDEPAVVNPGDNTTTDVELDDFKYFKAECTAFGSNVTIEQHDLVGHVFVYASIEVQNPSPLDPPSMVYRNETNAVIKTITVLLPSNSSTKLVYVSIQGKNLTNVFSLYIYDTLFEHINYDASVIENVPSGTLVFQVQADFRSGFDFTYEITEGNVDNAFTIDPYSGEITTNRPLNYEVRETYTLSIRAQDMRLLCHRGKTQVTVRVRKVTVVEDVSPGHLVAQINLNKGVNASIHYSISTTTAPFKINQVTGELTTTGNLDREQEDNYKIIVIGQDGKGLTAIVNVSITVLDVNDNSPTFSRPQYSGIFDPTLSNDVTTVMATDPDLNENGTVRYQVDMSTHARNSSHNYTVIIAGHDLGTPRRSQNVDVFIDNRSPCPLLQFSVDAISGVVTADTTCSAPVIIQGPKNITVEVRQTVYLVCLVDGRPTPRISWFFNNDTMVPDDFVQDPSNFTITEVAPLHLGFYHCEAVNEVGQARSQSAFVQVYEPGDLIGIIISVEEPDDNLPCHMFSQNEFESALQIVVGADIVTTAPDDNVCPQSPCFPNPCNNEGSCTEIENTFTCRCKPGWTSSRCNVDINECDRAPCVNGGTCSNTPQGSFTCICPDGYEGHQCDLVTDVCANNSCSENEQCVSDQGGYQCVSNDDGVVVEINVDGDEPQFIIEEDIEFQLGLTGSRKRRAVGAALDTHACRVRVLSQKQLTESTAQVQFFVLCPNGDNVSVNADSLYCDNLVQSGLYDNCQAGNDGKVFNKLILDPSVSIQLFIADQTGKPLPAAEALALVETKNAIAIMAEKYGYNISSISAVSPVTLEASSSLSGGAVAGIVISVLIITAIGIAAAVWLKMRFYKSEDLKTARGHSSNSDPVYEDAESGNVQTIKRQERCQESPENTVAIENVYANQSPVKSNSLRVPKHPIRVSQEQLMPGINTSQIPSAQYTGMGDLVLFNPTYGLTDESQAWFHGDISRQEAETRLTACGDDGAFLVRVSSKSGGYSLSINTPQLSKPFRHVLINKTDDGTFRVDLTDSSNIVYNTIGDIMNHYTQNVIKFGNESVYLTTPVSRLA